MKRGGILHPLLAKTVAEMGHGDLLVLADAGLPIPPGVQRIDLAYAPGRPGLLEVLEVVLGELAVEAAVVASELKERSPSFHAQLLSLLPVAPGYVSHEELKALLSGARAVVRTGEFTPYANVVLRAGVVF